MKIESRTEGRGRSTHILKQTRRKSIKRNSNATFVIRIYIIA